MSTGFILWDSKLSRFAVLGLAIIFFPGTGFGEPASIKSGVNQKTFTIEVREGTAGKAGGGISRPPGRSKHRSPSLRRRSPVYGRRGSRGAGFRSQPWC